MTKKADWGWFFVFLATALTIELGASFLTFSSARTWYSTLNKPVWTPPNNVFGPVWTFLYITIACSGWIICVEKTTISKKIAFLCYGLQFFFNFFWSYLFFYKQNPDLALIDMFLLLGTLVGTILSFFKISKVAAILLMPYLIWLLYAAALNSAICLLN